MWNFLSTMFRICGHIERTIIPYGPSIIHYHGWRDVCLRPIDRKTTKNGICERCRTARNQASMAKAERAYAATQVGNKITRPEIAVDFRGTNEGGRRTRRTKHREVEMGRRDREGVKDSRVVTDVEHLKPEYKEALGGPRALVDATCLRTDNAGNAALHGPRAMPSTERRFKENWNLMTFTNPLRRCNGGRLNLHGSKPITASMPSPIQAPAPRSAPVVRMFGPRDLMAFGSDPLVRQEVKPREDAHVQYTQQKVRPLPSPPLRPLPQPPVQNPQRQLIKPNTVSFHVHSWYRPIAHDPNRIPPLPITYQPILTGRHPLGRPLPPIPIENSPEEEAYRQPPPVPRHIELSRRKAIAMHAHDTLWQLAAPRNQAIAMSADHSLESSIGLPQQRAIAMTEHNTHPYLIKREAIATQVQNVSPQQIVPQRESIPMPEHNTPPHQIKRKALPIHANNTPLQMTAPPQRKALPMHAHNDCYSPLEEHLSTAGFPLARRNLSPGWEPPRCETVFPEKSADGSKAVMDSNEVELWHGGVRV